MKQRRVLKPRSHNRSQGGPHPFWTPPDAEAPAIHFDLLAEALPLIPTRCAFGTAECSTCGCRILGAAPWATFANPTPRLQHVCEHCFRSLALAIDAGDLPAEDPF